MSETSPVASAQALYRRETRPQDVSDILVDMNSPADPVLLRMAPT
jgi:hypothetical protein